MSGKNFNYEYLMSMLDPTSMVARGIGFSWSDVRLNVPASDVYYYYIKTPPSKHLIVYNRAFEAAEGPVHLETVVDATFSLISSILKPGFNLFAGLAAPQSEIRGNVTSVSGGYLELLHTIMAQETKRQLPPLPGLLQFSLQI